MKASSEAHTVALRHVGTAMFVHGMVVVAFSPGDGCRLVLMQQSAGSRVAYLSSFSHGATATMVLPWGRGYVWCFRCTFCVGVSRWRAGLESARLACWECAFRPAA